MTTNKEVTCNGRSYAWPNAPTVVICLDGSEPGYIEETIKTGRAPTFARFMKDGAQHVGRQRDPELHQSEQSVDHHRPPTGGARHRRQLLL